MKITKRKIGIQSEIYNNIIAGLFPNKNKKDTKMKISLSLNKKPSEKPYEKYIHVINPDGEIVLGIKQPGKRSVKQPDNQPDNQDYKGQNPYFQQQGPNPYLDNSIDPFNKFKRELNDYCYDNITNYNMSIFLIYIQEFIQEFLFDKENKYSDIEVKGEKSKHPFKDLCAMMDILNDEIISKLYNIITDKQKKYTEFNNTEFIYKDYDVSDYTRDVVLTNIKITIDYFNIRSRDILIYSIDPAYYYIHRISIILRRLLLDLYDIIQGKQFILTYIPIKYIKLFIYNIDFRYDKCNKKELLVKCQKGDITNYNMKCFLEYIKEFINKFINERNNNNNKINILYNLMNDFNNDILIKLYDTVNNNNNDNYYVYTDKDISNYNRIELVEHIRKTIKDLKEISKYLIDNTESVSYYIHHIAIILRRLLFDLYEIIEGKQIFLAYIPIKYMELFISKIHFRNKCLKDDDIIGGVGKKYKKTNNKITVLYKKKKYTRNIHINERKKYVKINKTFILLSKLKKI